jgi:CrcB protein
MIDFKNIALVVFGSATGGTLRYIISLFFIAKELNKLPWATFSVNLIGCFLIGVVYAFSDKYGHGESQLKLLLATGFCGGFTTFSAFTLENLQLLKQHAFTTAFVYIFVSVILGIGATFLGFILFK